MKNFADRLLDFIDEVHNPSCIGLDPRIESIPKSVKQKAMDEFNVKPGDTTENAWAASALAIELFNKAIIDATYDLVPIYKPQAAFYEPYKQFGMKALENTANYVKSHGRLVVLDAKRNDIGETAQSYADAYLGSVTLVSDVTLPSFSFDALTSNVYLGSDGVKPFIEVCKRDGKGIFVLAKTSNPSSLEFQDLKLDDIHGGRKLYEQVALKMEILGRELVGERGYSSLGLVVGASGATPDLVREMAARIRRLNPFAIILVPGYGQQGGMGKDTVPNFNREGYGAIVNNSRGIIFAYTREPFKSAYKPDQFAEAARESTIAMRDDIVTSLREAGFKGWSN